MLEQLHQTKISFEEKLGKEMPCCFNYNNNNNNNAIIVYLHAYSTVQSRTKRKKETKDKTRQLASFTH
jgi:hypothetical protein